MSQEREAILAIRTRVDDYDRQMKDTTEKQALFRVSSTSDTRPRVYLGSPGKIRSAYSLENPINSRIELSTFSLQKTLRLFVNQNIPRASQSGRAPRRRGAGANIYSPAEVSAFLV